MIDTVRSQYGYTDEYILTKTYTWLKSAIELISRRTYNQAVFETELLVSQIAGVLGGKVEKLKSFDEIRMKEKKSKKATTSKLANAMQKYK